MQIALFGWAEKKNGKEIAHHRYSSLASRTSQKCDEKSDSKNEYECVRGRALSEEKEIARQEGGGVGPIWDRHRFSAIFQSKNRCAMHITWQPDRRYTILVTHTISTIIKFNNVLERQILNILLLFVFLREKKTRAKRNEKKFAPTRIGLVASWARFEESLPFASFAWKMLCVWSVCTHCVLQLPIIRFITVIVQNLSLCHSSPHFLSDRNLSNLFTYTKNVEICHRWARKEKRQQWLPLLSPSSTTLAIRYYVKLLEYGKYHSKC